MDSAIRRVPSGFPGWVAYFHVYGGFGEYIIAREARPGGAQARPTDLLRPAQMPYRFPRAGASFSCSKTWAQLWAQNPPEYRAIPWSIMQGSGRRTNYIAFLEQSVGPRFKSLRAHQQFETLSSLGVPPRFGSLSGFLPRLQKHFERSFAEKRHYVSEEDS